ncbi:hypothetical protein [Streptomyces antimycoticus]|uniref:Uncharacterized protein n=1 Tax=Streptomyces antimycoticus TaxID=68175 RepID=A0A4D4KJG5_9ACTN|nr:hypothetical protein [Streptomyces antimycoticus]GDY49085.1 hypothetical protein SANT12839_099670 [Streptomyces antimycoticus]
MSRITVIVEPRHANNSPCKHAVKPSGKPRDPESGCPGRTGSPSCAASTATSADPTT